MLSLGGVRTRGDVTGWGIQIARAGRFGTKGLAISFVSEKSDADTLNRVQDRIDVTITEMPEKIEPSTYIEKWQS